MSDRTGNSDVDSSSTAANSPGSLNGKNGHKPAKSGSLPISQLGANVKRSAVKSSSNARTQQRNRSKAPKSWKPLYQHWWAWLLLGLGATVGGILISGYTTIQEMRKELPESSEVLTYVRNGTLTIKASDGTILQQLGPATREKIPIDKIPERLIQAFIASEDKNFYEHDGVDYQAIARAVRTNIAAGEVVEGGSTITQQLARIVFLDQERTLERKLREALLAQKIEQELDKKQILERYLNLVYLGSGAYGVADAAWIYFGKSVDKLTLAEMAMIAGMPPAPSFFSPLVNLKIAQQRRDIVLQRMVEAGFITPAEISQARAEPLTLNPKLPRNLYSRVPYFTSYIQQQLPKLISQEELEIGGLTIETTLNLKWQMLAQQTVKDAIANYGPGQNFTQAAMVTLDPRTGEIKTMVGGDDFNKTQFNRVTQAQRQPGSTFKTLVYTTGIAAGFSPYKPYVDAKFVVDGYEPQNYGRTYKGTVSIRDALISSINIVAVKALIDIGFDPVIEMSKRMGIKSELYPTYSLALGASEVNLLELTSAYGTLANKGKFVEPHGIVRILNRYGDVVYESKFESKQATDEETAAIMTWMLQGVVQSGTGRRARLPDRQIAGKTGTSEERRDLWFVGYLPQLVTGVWLGNDNSKPTWGASSTAAQTWNDFMGELIDEIPVAEFPDLPRLEGRRGSIKAEPVRPRRISNRGQNDGEESRRSRSRREREFTEPAQERHSESELRDPSSERDRSSTPIHEPIYLEKPASELEIKPSSTEAAPPPPAPEPPPPPPVPEPPPPAPAEASTP
jgi:penicillin-binding protein 1A